MKAAALPSLLKLEQGTSPGSDWRLLGYEFQCDENAQVCYGGRRCTSI